MLSWFLETALHDAPVNVSTAGEKGNRRPSHLSPAFMAHNGHFEDGIPDLGRIE